jgi:hypothetical protein
LAEARLQGTLKYQGRQAIDDVSSHGDFGKKKQALVMPPSRARFAKRNLKAALLSRFGSRTSSSPKTSA